jgi:hypothetical protein
MSECFFVVVADVVAGSELFPKNIYPAHESPKKAARYMSILPFDGRLCGAADLPFWNCGREGIRGK